MKNLLFKKARTCRIQRQKPDTLPLSDIGLDVAGNQASRGLDFIGLTGLSGVKSKPISVKNDFRLSQIGFSSTTARD